jgi:hypothetical protein
MISLLAWPQFGQAITDRSIMGRADRSWIHRARGIAGVGRGADQRRNARLLIVEDDGSGVRLADTSAFATPGIRARLFSRSAGTCAQVRQLGAAHLHRVRAKIADLRRMETSLAAMVALCSDGVTPECPLIDAMFAEPTLAAHHIE